MSLTQEPPHASDVPDVGSNPRTPRRGNRLPWIVCGLVCLVVALAAALVVVVIDERSPAPVSASSPTGSAYAPSSPGTGGYSSGFPSVAPSTSAGDARACGALNQYGRAFYVETYRPVMLRGRGGYVTMDFEPIRLAAQLGVLDMKLDSATLADASQPVRSALQDAADDAGSLAQAYANVRVYGGRAPELTPIITSFTEALTSCTSAGYQPSYFNISEIAGR